MVPDKEIMKETDREAMEKLISWQKEFGRHGLPWQESVDPYVRCVAEVMLQQTQVSTVIPYFLRFIGRFPTVKSLAQAPQEEVLELWSGLGYYSRAINLQRCSQRVIEDFGGLFPNSIKELEKLPGIGRSTAGAIHSAVTDKPAAVLDGNVKRVLSRFRMIGLQSSEVKQTALLWHEAERFLPEREGRVFSQAMMDLGAMICLRSQPLCLLCPLKVACKAFIHGKQSEYPPKRKKPPSKEEEVFFNVFIEDGKIFLILREGSYWKNLWVPPSVGEKPQGTLLGKIKHKLTHLNLNLFFFEGVERNCTEGKWFSLDEIQAGALPTPVKKFLTTLL